MSDEVKEAPKPVNEASRLLFAQATSSYSREVQALAEMAFRVDGVDSKTFALNLDTLTYHPKPVA